MKLKNLSIYFLMISTPVFGAKNIFTIVPTIKAPSVIYPGQTAVAYYQVTNNTPFNLTNLSLHNPPPGIVQNPSTAGLSPQGLITCRGQFSLAPGASCLLKLNIVADLMQRPITAGPVICQNTNAARPLYCSSPDSVNNILDIRRANTIPDVAPTLSISPTTLSLTTGNLQTITVTNTSNTITVNNILPDFSETILEYKIQMVTPNPGGEPSCDSVGPGENCVLSLVSYSQAPMTPNTTFNIQGANSKSISASASIAYAPPNPIYQTLLSSPLINADIWEDTPKILSANYGFEGIEAAPYGETNVISAGGIWNIIYTEGASYQAYTTTGLSSDISQYYGYTVYYNDAMPICFSQPILSSTINPTDFRITLNTGEIITPNVASLTPNFFYNESSCVVVFGLFGNRIPPGEYGAIYPTTVSIVQGSSNGTPINLTLVGPGQVLTSMVGSSISSTNPYVTNGGPQLLSAKLSFMSDVAVGQDTQPAFNTNVPNDGISYYGLENAIYRLRVYTSGGFFLGNIVPSADRSISLQPSDYNTLFRIQVGSCDNPIYLYQSGVDYAIPGYGTIQVVGLASLAKAGTPENDAYVGTNNNYIDIILKGDESAIRLITYVDIPTTGTNPATGTPYLKVYNPGGPGNNPTPGIYYTQPGPQVHMAVVQALDDPNLVSYP